MSVVLEHIVELNLSSFHFLPDLGLMEPLQEYTLNPLQALSAPPCEFLSQYAVSRLPTSCTNLRDLDVRIDRRGGHLQCSYCELLHSRATLQSPPSFADLVFHHSGVAKLTLCHMPAHVGLRFVECYEVTGMLRLAEWPAVESVKYSHLGRVFFCCNSAIRCLVLQHKHLPISDKHPQASLFLLTSIQHLCLLTSMPVLGVDASTFVRGAQVRAPALSAWH